MLDALDIFRVLLLRVRVVESQVARAAVLLGQSEIKRNRLGVANVQITVRLWREARLHPSAVLALGQILFHLLLNEIEAFLLFNRLFVFLNHNVKV